MTLKEIVKQIWEDGVRDFDEIDKNWDPSDIQEGIDETFEEYWNDDKEREIATQLNKLYN